MNKLLCLMLACVAVTVVLAANASPNTGSVPVVAWSNFNAFKGKSEFLDSLNDLDFAALLSLAAGKASMQKFKLSPFVNTPMKPEILVVFGAHELRTDAFALAASNEQLPSLQAALAQASSSLITPYFYRVSDLSQTLLAITKIAPVFSVDQDILVGSKANNNRVTVVDAENLAETVAKINSNGATEVLYVPVSDDSQIASVLSLIDNKPFIAIYTSDSTVTLTQYPYDAVSRRDTAAANTFANRWPAYIFQFLLVSLLLLVILFAGCLCTMQIQTPTRYEIKKIEQIQ
eukprot:CAMPEP_0184659560 /NCGR_PEP_ID=MMETSP0308-20130426/30188_1 /TAXON_ID=38269 /ORGANISM="Gloeochaete witrockiana, Strain SAG 46.84" /LENGTH=288 /DNA_ID=CAMNT_0027099487 /DNA_START=23 /DNA_END=889 /DNA_ORIENTATION=-